MSDMIRISEIFGPTIQGEGALIGRPTVFVRTGGCDYRCDWCDTLHAVDSEYRHEWKPMSAQDIMARVEELSGGAPLMITLSGGNPAIQPLGELIRLGKDKGYEFAMETQGSVSQKWFADLDVLTLSPKPPSSGEATHWGKLASCVDIAAHSADIAMKLVVKDEIDYNYAREVAQRYPLLPLFLQPVNHTPPSEDSDAVDMDGVMDRMRWLVDRVLEDQWYDVTVLPQLHVLLWGNQKGV